MAGSREVRYRLVLDGAKQAASDFDKFSASILKGVSAWAAYRVAVDAIKAQSEAEDSINRLNLALANQGKLTDSTSKNLIAYAAAMQQATTFSDDAVIAAEAMAATFGMNEEQIKRVTQAAADFSAATGKDLQDSITMLGKAYVGNTTALQKMGFEFDAGQTKAQKFESAVAQIEKRFGGSAQNATKTFAGQIAQLKNDFNDAQEGLGFFLGELLRTEGVSGQATSALQGIAQFLKTDMVVALSEVRAQWLEFLADMVKGTGAGGVLSKIIDLSPAGSAIKLLTGKGAADYLTGGTSEATLRGLANGIREAGNAAAKAGAQTQTYTNALRGMKAEAGAATAKTYDVSGYIADTVDFNDLPTLPPFVQNQLTKDLITDFKPPAFSSQIAEATRKTFDWQKALMGALQIIQGIAGALGGSSRGSAIGGSIGALAGSFIPLPIPGLGAALGGLFGGLLGGLFGGGPSQEELAAERKRQQEEAARIAGERQAKINAGARSSMQSGVEGILGIGPEFFASRPIVTADDARRQGIQFAAAWGAVVREKGIVAAAQAFEDAFTKMREDMRAQGLDEPEWVKAIAQQMELGLDEKFAALAEGAQQAAEFLKALAEAGALTPELLGTFEDEVRRIFGGARDRALELGQSPEEAIQAGFNAANPLLKQLLNQSILSRQSLSQDIQDMIDKAGIVPDVEYQSLDELRAIRAAVEKLAGINGNGGGGGGGSQPGAGGGDDGGGPIIPKPGGSPGGSPFTAPSTSGFGSVTIPLYLDGREVARSQARVIRRRTFPKLNREISRVRGR